MAVLAKVSGAALESSWALWRGARRPALPGAWALLSLWALLSVAVGCRPGAEAPAVAPMAAESRAQDGTPTRPPVERAALDSRPVEMRVDGKPVTAVMRLPRGTAAPGDEFEVTVELLIAPMWEIQPLGAAADGAAPTQLELVLPPGVTASSEWTSPKTGRSLAPDGHAVHAGRVTFTRTLAIAASAPAGPATISCQVAFQACNDRTCLKPQAIELALPLSIKGVRNLFSQSEPDIKKGS